MGGPIVRTGTTPEFWKNWDRIFGDESAGKGKKKSAKASAKSSKKSAAKKSNKKKAGKGKKK